MHSLSIGDRLLSIPEKENGRNVMWHTRHETDPEDNYCSAPFVAITEFSDFLSWMNRGRKEVHKSLTGETSI